MLIYLHIGQLDDRYIPLKHAAEHDRLCPAHWCGVGLAPTNFGAFNKYMETLSEITLYKTLIEAQTRADLSDQDDAAGSRRRTHA